MPPDWPAACPEFRRILDKRRPPARLRSRTSSYLLFLATNGVTVHSAAGDWSIFRPINASWLNRGGPKTWTSPLPFRPVNGYNRPYRTQIKFPISISLSVPYAKPIHHLLSLRGGHSASCLAACSRAGRGHAPASTPTPAAPARLRGFNADLKPDVLDEATSRWHANAIRHGFPINVWVKWNHLKMDDAWKRALAELPAGLDAAAARGLTVIITVPGGNNARD